MMLAQLTAAQRRVIEEVFACADEDCERVPVEQLLGEGVIDAIVTLNEHLAEFGWDGSPEPGPEWDDHIVVIFDEGRAMLGVDPWGDVDGDLPGR